MIAAMDRAPRVAVPLAAALLGFLAVVAASQPPQALRETRRLELADLIREEDARVRALRRQVRALERELGAIARTRSEAGSGLRGLESRSRELAMRAGVAPARGPGVMVTLDDSSASRSPTGDPNDLIVHERDIQTVVNALWASGAEAVALAGERLTSGSAVRCAGNTLLLHGTLRSPPYRISAIGEPAALETALLGQPGMGRMLAAVQAFGLGFSVERATVEMPSSGPPLILRAAEPVEAVA
jgi:uncharacterized protein YlxW (UPF0749 family)